MAEFYIERAATEAGEHVVHKSTCPSLPELGTLFYAGARSTVSAPINEAPEWQLSPAVACPVCNG